MVFFYGETVNGIPNGKGKMVYQDNSTYIGDFRHGRRTDKGKYTKIDLETGKKYFYLGSWLNDQKSGFGKEIDLLGNVYEGSFKEDKYHGFGKYIYKDGVVYSGKFEKGMKWGYGLCKWPDA